MNSREPSDHRGHIDDDACTDLVLGVLPENESELALQHIGVCPACEMKFQRMAGEWEVLATAAAPETPDTSRADRRETSTVWQKLAGAFGARGVRVGLAAGIAVLLFVFMLPRRTADPVTDMLTKLPVIDVRGDTRTGAPPMGNQALAAGLEAYDRGEFETAAQRFREAQTTGPSDVFRNVYLGNSLAWNGKYTEAINVLEDLPFDLVPAPWGAEAHWTLYAALRGAKQDARADSLLEDLAKYPGEVGSRAQQVLRRPE